MYFSPLLEYPLDGETKLYASKARLATRACSLPISALCLTPRKWPKSYHDNYSFTEQIYSGYRCNQFHSNAKEIIIVVTWWEFIFIFFYKAKNPCPGLRKRRRAVECSTSKSPKTVSVAFPSFLPCSSTIVELVSVILQKQAQVPDATRIPRRHQ